MSKLIDKQVDEMLTAAGIKYTATLLGATRNTSWGNVECDQWVIKFHAPFSKIGTFPYYTGTGLRKKPKSFSRNAKPEAVTPPAASVLYCLLSDASAVDMNHHDWCDTFGYDRDSRKALQIYTTCLEQSERLLQIFPRPLIDELEELLSEY